MLFAGLIEGGSYIQTAFGIPNAVSSVIQALILFCVLGSEFFTKYKIVPNKISNKNQIQVNESSEKETAVGGDE